MKLEFKNPLWVAGAIDNQNFYINFTKRLSEVIANTKEADEITILINSPGGESNTALGIFDLLNSCNRKSIGVVSGIAHSGASLILQACKIRMMTRNSNLMLHKSTVQVGGAVDNAQEALNALRKVDEKYYEIYADKSGENFSKISEMAHKDKYFNAQEALDAGLIDEIVE